ncbi:MAG: M23 family metallopeptidase [Prevotellaceae bacterium]|jgi:murein DD-endopeptidase MepM/ murein hydrolase activator NlpD|nr:M23 family metallopeptidase [Prevotellaceae bacterium]
MAKEKDHSQPKQPGMLKNKYRLTVYNDTTLDQRWQLRTSGLGALVSGMLFILMLIVVVTVLIAFTGLREFIPGYPDATTREKLVNNALRADSLERTVLQWERHLTNINLLLAGKAPMPIDTKRPDSVHVKDFSTPFAPSREDSLLRREIEENDSYNPLAPALSGGGERMAPAMSIESLFLFPPVQGAITDSFNVQTGHTAIDVVTQPHTPVMAVLDGTVIIADWIPVTGNVIQLQHDYGIISVYKHNEKLLKKRGDRVKAGEAIAIVGNSGELTTGPHLHFELWHNGSPVDPLRYIKF